MKKWDNFSERRHKLLTWTQNNVLSIIPYTFALFKVNEYFKKVFWRKNHPKCCILASLTEYSGVTLLFVHLPSRVSEIDHFEIFSCLQENQLAQWFFVKFNLLLLFLISLFFLILGVFYAYAEEYKHNDCFIKKKQTFTICTK